MLPKRIQGHRRQLVGLLDEHIKVTAEARPCPRIALVTNAFFVDMLHLLLSNVLRYPTIENESEAAELRI